MNTCTYHNRNEQFFKSIILSTKYMLITNPEHIILGIFNYVTKYIIHNFVNQNIKQYAV